MRPLAEVTALSSEGSRRLPDSVPRVMAANPYVGLASTLGPEGERWIPAHGVFPLSAVNETWDRVDELFAEYAEPIERFRDRDRPAHRGGGPGKLHSRGGFLLAGDPATCGTIGCSTPRSRAATAPSRTTPR